MVYILFVIYFFSLNSMFLRPIYAAVRTYIVHSFLLTNCVKLYEFNNCVEYVLNCMSMCMNMNCMNMCTYHSSWYQSFVHFQLFAIQY